MSPVIIKEVTLLWHAFLLGAAIAFGYDFLRIFRRCIRHGRFWVSLEDILFWMVCALVIFAMFYRENNGMFRWSVIPGAAAGLYLYEKTFSPAWVYGMSWVMGKVLFACGKLFGVLLFPFVFLGRKAGILKRKSCRIFRQGVCCAKKKLTMRAKIGKIALCKRLAHRGDRDGKETADL